MNCRGLTSAALVAGLVCASLATYHARLWFKDETTGAENAGAVAIRPGDLIFLSFSFHRDAGDTTSRWTSLQMFTDLGSVGPNSILTDADANTWDATIDNYVGVPENVPPLVWQPSDGPIHDNGEDPSDSTSAEITSKGVYALLGVKGGSVESHDVDSLGYFTFHVGTEAAPGSELRWGLDGRDTENGITTRMYDSMNRSVKVTDNWLIVVPEPGGWLAMGTGLLALLGLRHGKRE